jgi:hypothetical protein
VPDISKTLASYEMAKVTAVKRFCTTAPEVNYRLGKKLPNFLEKVAKTVSEPKRCQIKHKKFRLKAQKSTFTHFRNLNKSCF